MSKDLLPCPFCGGKAELWLDFESYRTEYEYDEKNVYRCGCKNCGIVFSAYWEKEWAVEQWNTRAPTVIKTEAIKEFAERLKDRMIVTHKSKEGICVYEFDDELIDNLVKDMALPHFYERSDCDE